MEKFTLTADKKGNLVLRVGTGFLLTRRSIEDFREPVRAYIDNARSDSEEAKTLKAFFLKKPEEEL